MHCHLSAKLHTLVFCMFLYQCKYKVKQVNWKHLNFNEHILFHTCNRYRAWTWVHGVLEELNGQSLGQSALISQLTLLWAAGWVKDLLRSPPTWVILQTVTAVNRTVYNSLVKQLQVVVYPYLDFYLGGNFIMHYWKLIQIDCLKSESFPDTSTSWLIQLNLFASQSIIFRLLLYFPLFPLWPSHDADSAQLLRIDILSMFPKSFSLTH